MSITLEEIKSTQTKLAEMIAAFEAQARESIHFPEQIIDLAPGESYAGIILGKDGEASHHLILLPGEAENIKWEKAQKWANKAGGELPTRREQSLLYANLKEQFQSAWYWSGEQHAAHSDYAWSQNFDYGDQFILKGIELRARAVRRLKI